MILDSDPSHALSDQGKVACWISGVTGEAEASVRSRLLSEYEEPGSTVRQALGEAGLEPFVWSDALIRFYEQTDAFLYELVIWNLNRMKVWMRSAVGRHLSNGHTEPLDVLNIGDGLGIDSVHFARAGHRVTYYEVPGYSQSFARKFFDDCGVDIDVLTDEADIPTKAFDVVVCLDVLEHMPDPPAYVRRIGGYLRPGGRLIVNAPFMVIHRSTMTHLKSNRRYSGSLSLFTRSGFRLLDGELGWNPLVLQYVVDRTAGAEPAAGAGRIAGAGRAGGIAGTGGAVGANGSTPSPSPWTPKRLALRAAGCVLSLGRWPIVPLSLADRFRHRQRQWFNGKTTPD